MRVDILGSIGALYAIIFGAQPLREWIIYLYNNMWWMSIFGSLRYAWLRQTLLRNKNARISPDELIDPLFYVIDTWNPTDDLSDVLYCVDLYHYEVYSPGMVCKVLMDAINVTISISYNRPKLLYGPLSKLPTPSSVYYIHSIKKQKNIYTSF